MKLIKPYLLLVFPLISASKYTRENKQSVCFPGAEVNLSDELRELGVLGYGREEWRQKLTSDPTVIKAGPNTNLGIEERKETERALLSSADNKIKGQLEDLNVSPPNKAQFVCNSPPASIELGLNVLDTTSCRPNTYQEETPKSQLINHVSPVDLSASPSDSSYEKEIQANILRETVLKIESFGLKLLNPSVLTMHTPTAKDITYALKLLRNMHKDGIFSDQAWKQVELTIFELQKMNALVYGRLEIFGEYFRGSSKVPPHKWSEFNSKSVKIIGGFSPSILVLLSICGIQKEQVYAIQSDYHKVQLRSLKSMYSRGADRHNYYANISEPFAPCTDALKTIRAQMDREYTGNVYFLELVKFALNEDAITWNLEAIMGKFSTSSNLSGCSIRQILKGGLSGIERLKASVLEEFICDRQKDKFLISHSLHVIFHSLCRSFMQLVTFALCPINVPIMGADSISDMLIADSLRFREIMQEIAEHLTREMDRAI